MRWSLGLGPTGAALLLAAALPIVDGGGWLAGARTAAAQSAPQDRKAGTKRQVAKSKSKSKSADADSKGGRAPADTDRLLDTAAKAIAEGNADAAMSTLDGVLSGGGLANKHMARALYLRGVAHRKKARPAQAIADLTSAVWLKDGLSDADRTAALKERSEISAEIGVADAGAPPSAATATPAPSGRQAPAAQSGFVTRPPPVGSAGLTEGGFPRIADAAPQRTAPPPRATPEPPAPAAQTGLIRRPPPAGTPGLTEGGFPRVVATAPPNTPPATSQPPRAGSSGERVSTNAGPSTSSWQSGTSVATTDGRVPAEERPISRAGAPAPGGSPDSGGGLGEFFSGLFGTGSASAPQPSKATKSDDARPWATSTREPKSRRAPEKPSATSVAVVTSAAPPPSKPQDGYRIQIAVLRNRSEATALAARVTKEHGRDFGARKLEVDETVLGNMGTFYRVRLGPFTAVAQWKGLCAQLRTKGYDCLVIQ
jgi:hypothetical protein